MNDFDYDCMQKKRIAMGAFAHINRRRGGCSLPSDALTEKQRKEKNGEVKSYNITRPMPWREFKAMPEDLKREFFRNMQSFGGTAKWLAEEMNACDATIRRECGAYANGYTATGAKATQGVTIAADPDVLPMGTEIELDGHTYTVQDTGGAIAGNRLDLYFDSHEDALQWGVREKVVRWAE